jgi:EAL domain-containing protein (putative c-di-GMP-specific phosphodiesterase class I)
MWDGRLHRIGASAGITLIDADNHQAAEVMSQADIACYASKNSGRGVVTVYEAQQERMQSNRSMMSLDEQWHMIKDNNLVMLARSVASPRIPESSNFWMLSLRLWTSEGEVLEEQAFRAGLAEPELLHALDRRVMQEFFRNFAAPLANKGTGVALPLSLAGLASVTLVDELLEMLEQSPLQARLLHLVVHVEVLNLQDKNSLLGLEKLRCAGCRIVLNYVGRDMDVFNHLNAHMADYLLLAAALLTAVMAHWVDTLVILGVAVINALIGHVHDFANEVEPWHLASLHGSGGEFVGVHTAEGDFCGAIPFGTVGLHTPFSEGFDQRLLVTAIKLLQGDIRDLPQQDQTLHQPFRQLHRQGIFQALIRVRRTLLIQETVEIALGQQIHRHELPRQPVAGDLQHGRAGKTPMGKQQIFTENRTVFGCNHRRHRDAGEGLQLLQQRFMQGKWYQSGAGRKYLQAKLLGDFIAKRRCAQPRHRQAAAGNHQTLSTHGFAIQLQGIAPSKKVCALS